MEPTVRSHAVQRVRSLRHFLAFGATVLACMVYSPSFAAEDAKQRAIGLLDQGNARFKERQFEAALKFYEEAYQAFPSPKILLNIAESHRELGAADEAARYYEQFLDEAPEQERNRALAIERLEQAKASLGFIQLDCAVEGAEVALNGKAIGKTPLQPVRVVAGRHKVSAQHVDHHPFSADVMVHAQQTLALNLELAPLTPSVPAAKGASPALSDSAATPSIDAVPDPRLVPEDPGAQGQPIVEKWWFWSAIGVVVLGGVGTAVALASGGGSDFVPSGELGKSGTSQWATFAPGGGR